LKTRRFFLRPYPPFRLDLTVWALRRRPRNLIDRWDGTHYSRVLAFDGSPVHLVASQTAPSERPEIECVYICERRVVKSEQVGAAVERLLGLNVDMSEFQLLAQRDSRLRKLIGRFAGFRPPRFPTVFEAAVNAVCCQQLSLEVGLELLNRLGAHAGLKLKDASESFFGPPEPRKVAELAPRKLRELGFSSQKAAALLEIARLFADESERLENLSSANDQEVMSCLMRQKGIGRWSAEYILLRGLGRLNVFPGDDIAAAKNLRQWLGIGRERQQLGYDEIRATLQKWDPYQGLVYFYLLLGSLAARGWLDSGEAADSRG
jgi:DNA-3-methyladenine glycosylase II